MQDRTIKQMNTKRNRSKYSQYDRVVEAWAEQKGKLETALSEYSIRVFIMGFMLGVDSERKEQQKRTKPVSKDL